MKKIILQFFAVLFFAISIAAQVNQPRLFDEFGKMPLDEMIARVNNLALEVRNTPNSRALIRIYGGQDRFFVAPFDQGSTMKAIWENNLKFPAEKLSIRFCDLNSEPIQTKFFIVRENDQVEPCDENPILPKETMLFDRVTFYYRRFKITATEKLPVEFGFSDGEYSAFAQNILKGFLNSSPASRVYLIAYLKTNFEEDENGKIIKKRTGSLDNRYLAGKMIRAARQELLKNGFSASQIVALDGGYLNADERRLEFWFVPPGGAIPKPKPDYVSKKSD